MRRRDEKRLFLPALGFFLAILACAGTMRGDEFHLKDGSKIVGTIVGFGTITSGFIANAGVVSATNGELRLLGLATGAGAYRAVTERGPEARATQTPPSAPDQGESKPAPAPRDIRRVGPREDQTR